MQPIPTPGLRSVVRDGVDEELESTQLGLALGITTMDADLGIQPSFTASEVSPGIQMISRLRAATLGLPESVPLATSTDELAPFAGNPEVEFRSCGDPWETIDQKTQCSNWLWWTPAAISFVLMRHKWPD